MREQLNILVAYGDRRVRCNLIDRLGRFGHTVIGVSNGKEALDHIKAEGFPDLIMTGVNMVILNGVGLVTMLKNKNNAVQFIDVPLFVFMTAEKDEFAHMSRSELEALGSLDIICVKSVTDADLRDIVSRVHDSMVIH